ncbi:amidohydrolase [Diaminobutyricimonas sp. LJ205]|uniref:amidohydrolase n=1 Tax=Diaminobutyricimonas sp. LJ205 TaxID=2683590 RepID=UPI0012F50C09|nr:amidohydrolase [Diaminobutyricimonas sp. LJ205]
MLLRNARLGDRAVDIRIEGGRTAEIGRRDDDRLIGDRSNEDTADLELDLDGRPVIPGLWDEHVHFSQWAMSLRRVDVQHADSPEAAAAIVADAVAANPPAPGSVVVGTGFRPGLWSRQPTFAVLDAIVGVVAANVPVVLISGDVHSVWLNSAALSVHGFAGHPTGVLVEDDCWAVLKALDDVPADVLDAWLTDAASAAAARGIVGITDLEFSLNLDHWQRRMAAGFDTLRVDAGFYTEHLDEVIGRGLKSGQRLNDLLTVGPYKIISDGSLNTRTAFCVDPYPGLTEHPHGMLNVPSDELRQLMSRATDAGLRMAVHAIGDEANRLALDAFEAIGCGGRIEHAQLLRAEDLARFAALGVEASVQPEHAMDDRDVADHYWAGRTDRAFVLRSLIDAGARVRLGSDAPVAPLDPWVSIAAAVGRTRDGREPWHAEQAITVDQAIEASVRSAVAVGEVADLVVLDADPHTVSATELRSMPVAATVLAGRFTFNTL